MGTYQLRIILLYCLQMYGNATLQNKDPFDGITKLDFEDTAQEGFYLQYWCKWHRQSYWLRDRLKFPHKHSLYICYCYSLCYCSFLNKIILKFCFEHLFVCQKRNKHPVPNKRPVSNKGPPPPRAPLELPKANNHPGC